MIVALLFLLAAQAAPAPVPAPVPDTPPSPPLPMPVDWAALAPLPYRAQPFVTPAMKNFVAAEIAAKRCTEPRPADGHYNIKVDVAVLVAADGTVRNTVPRAIQCPTVEQYTAGLVTSFARNNLLPRTAPQDQWYHAILVYDWQG